MKLAKKTTEFREITQNNGYYAVQGHSRLPILVPIESASESLDFIALYKSVFNI